MQRETWDCSTRHGHVKLGEKAREMRVGFLRTVEVVDSVVGWHQASLPRPARSGTAAIAASFLPLSCSSSDRPAQEESTSLHTHSHPRRLTHNHDHRACPPPPLMHGPPPSSPSDTSSNSTLHSSDPPAAAVHHQTLVQHLQWASPSQWAQVDPLQISRTPHRTPFAARPSQAASPVLRLSTPRSALSSSSPSPMHARSTSRAPSSSGSREPQTVSGPPRTTAGWTSGRNSAAPPSAYGTCVQSKRRTSKARRSRPSISMSQMLSVVSSSLETSPSRPRTVRTSPRCYHHSCRRRPASTKVHQRPYPQHRRVEFTPVQLSVHPGPNSVVYRTQACFLGKVASRGDIYGSFDTHHDTVWSVSVRLTPIYILTSTSGRDTRSSLLRGRMEGWARIRVSGQTDWKRMWMVISAGSGSSSDLARSSSNDGSGRPSTAEAPRKKRMSSLFSRDHQDEPLPQRPLLALYASPKSKDKKQPLLTLRELSQAFAVYPERPELISRSTLMKIEGHLGDEETGGSMRNRQGWLLVMPELEPGNTQPSEMLKWLVGKSASIEFFLTAHRVQLYTMRSSSMVDPSHIHGTPENKLP